MEYAQMNEAPSSVRDMPSEEQSRARHMRAAMDEYWASVTERAREAAAYADRQVHHNPWTAVGVGFGIGMIFGALVAMLASSQRSGIGRMM
ncbi:MAG TPA: hypothetical protein VG591_01415 [Burkholderiales bacterium]|jgi:ElaB/YqjD/DUF883 family membrane-anchored ribosome-binding protein|nr:hypothetical protein [Burkholderiales bacterium]